MNLKHSIASIFGGVDNYFQSDDQAAQAKKIPKVAALLELQGDIDETTKKKALAFTQEKPVKKMWRRYKTFNKLFSSLIGKNFPIDTQIKQLILEPGIKDTLDKATCPGVLLCVLPS